MKPSTVALLDEVDELFMIDDGNEAVHLRYSHDDLLDLIDALRNALITETGFDLA